MIDSTARCPNWLAGRINDQGGAISFYQYMDWVLNDPDHGVYSTGRLQIGRNGDFCTSPSLSNDFGFLLSNQVVEWLFQLEKASKNNQILSLVEIGPGEGSLSRDLINNIAEIAPYLIPKMELVLVELNEGMKSRQEKVVKSLKDIKIRWTDLDELKKNPVRGVIIAHEVLDAFPVERLIFRKNNVFRQGVALQKENNENYLEFIDLKTTISIDRFISESKSLLGIDFPPRGICDGWTTEWHCDVLPWFNDLSKALIDGPLLIVDYAMESNRYYSKRREDGTLISYRGQKANSNLLKDPGKCDLTSHLCMEATISYAIRNKWRFLGETRQGQALLALGLSELLYSLQNIAKNDIATALDRRESLLRLVSPMGLGEFRWLAFQKVNNSDLVIKSRFLEAPIK